MRNLGIFIFIEFSLVFSLHSSEEKMLSSENDTTHQASVAKLNNNEDAVGVSKLNDVIADSSFFSNRVTGNRSL